MHGVSMQAVCTTVEVCVLETGFLQFGGIAAFAAAGIVKACDSQSSLGMLYNDVQSIKGKRLQEPLDAVATVCRYVFHFSPNSVCTEGVLAECNKLARSF